MYPDRREFTHLRGVDERNLAGLHLGRLDDADDGDVAARAFPEIKRGIHAARTKLYHSEVLTIWRWR